MPIHPIHLICPSTHSSIWSSINIHHILAFCPSIHLVNLHLSIYLFHLMSFCTFIYSLHLFVHLFFLSSVHLCIPPYVRLSILFNIFSSICSLVLLLSICSLTHQYISMSIHSLSIFLLILCLYFFCSLSINFFWRFHI